MKKKRAAPRVFLKLPEVIARVTLSRSTILRNQGLGKFPHSIKISDSAIRWDEADIDEFMTACKEGRPWKPGK